MLGRRSLFEASVGFRGTEPSDPDPISAIVTADPVTPLNGVGALAYLVPLILAKSLFNNKVQPEVTAPTLDLLSRAGIALLEGGADGARGFCFREVADPGSASNQIAYFLEMGIPDVRAGSPGKPEIFVQGKLVPASDETLRAKLRIRPNRGPCLYTSLALFALIEHMANHSDFESATKPALGGIGTVAQAIGDLGSPDWLGRRELVAISVLATRAVGANAAKGHAPRT